MSNRIDDMLDELQAALETIVTPDGVIRVYRDAGANNVQPPAIVLGPPTFTWDGYCQGVTDATMSLWLVVKSDDRIMTRLFSTIEDISNTVDESVPDVSITSANPTSYPISDTASLPAYQFTVELNLR